MASVEDCIAKRADEVEKNGAYIGFFEWLAFAIHRRIDVELLVGTNVVNVHATFGSEIPRQIRRTGRAAFVRLTDRGSCLSAVDPAGQICGNHFVIGVASKGAPVAASLKKGRSGRCAVKQAMTVNWAVLPTVADGNCGPDAMAHMRALPRVQKTWDAVRTDLAAFMRRIRKDNLWQDAFKACQEMDTAGEALPVVGGLGPSVAVCGLGSAVASVLRPALAAAGGIGPSAAASSKQGVATAFLFGAVPPMASPPPPSKPVPAPPPSQASPPFQPAPAPPPSSALVPASPSVAAPASVLAPASCAVASDSVPASPSDAASAPSSVVASASVPASSAEPAAKLSFQQWLHNKNAEELASVTSSLEDFRAAEKEFIRDHVPPSTKGKEAEKRRPHTATKVNHKSATGFAYQKWRAGPGQSSAAPLRDFLQHTRRYDGPPPKKDRVWLRSCVQLAEELSSSWGSGLPTPPGGRKAISGRTPNSKLLRRRVKQGRPHKCPLIGEYLWDWFVDIRASVSAKVSPKFVLMKAKSIASDILKAQVSTGCYTPLPQLDKKWLWSWRRSRGIVFRYPNRRFKASKAKLVSRLRVMWMNVIRIRRLAQHFLGRDICDHIYGIDEKPLHFNENGSKVTRTLEIEGAPVVALKENHAATRERCSLMTAVSSNKAAVAQGLPVGRGVSFCVFGCQPEQDCRSRTGKGSVVCLFRHDYVGLRSCSSVAPDAVPNVVRVAFA